MSDLSSAPSPAIVGFVASDPEEMTKGYSSGDTVTIYFDRLTNRPVAASQTDMATWLLFSQSLGAAYSGEWRTPSPSSAIANAGDSLVITSVDTAGATAEVGRTTVRVIGDLRDAAGTSLPSRSVSAPLAGSFGFLGCWPYGVWWGGICWWGWVVIFCVIGCFVIGCTLFWICWWIRVRARLHYIAKLEDEETTASLSTDQRDAAIAAGVKDPYELPESLTHVPIVPQPSFLMPSDSKDRRKSSIMRFLYHAAGLSKSYVCLLLSYH